MATEYVYVCWINSRECTGDGNQILGIYSTEIKAIDKMIYLCNSCDADGYSWLFNNNPNTDEYVIETYEQFNGFMDAEGKYEGEYLYIQKVKLQ